MPTLTGRPSEWRLACHFHLSSFALCPLGNLEFDLCFPSTFRDLLPCRNGALGTDQTARADGQSPPCGSAQASQLDGAQIPASPKSQRDKGNTRYDHPAGICQSQEGLDPKPFDTRALRAARETQALWGDDGIFGLRAANGASCFLAPTQPRPPGPSKLPKDPIYF